RIVEDKQSIKAASQKTIAYQWNDNSNLKKITYPGARVIDYEFDEMDRISAIKESASNIALYEYQAYKERQKDLLNGASSVMSYGTGEQVTSIIDQDSGTSDIVNFTYTHDDVYNILSEKHNHVGGTPGDVYQYDSAYRLTNARYAVSSPETYNWTTDTGADKHDFAYDEVDNRTSVARTGESTEYYQANLLNQYPEIDTTQGPDTDNRTYDLNGNLTENEDGVGYTFDYKNHIVTAEKTDDWRLTFEYDHMGRRTYKKAESYDSGWSTDYEEYYYYTGDEVIEERDESDAVLRTYVLSGDLDNPVSFTEEAEAGSPDYYYHYNSLGSVYKLTDSSENIVEEYSYDSYGNLTIDTDDVDVHNPYFYTGRRYDPESGLYYYRDRYYDPETGTFISRDSLEYVDSSSLYSYVADSPTNHTDPYGNLTFWEGGPHIPGTSRGTDSMSASEFAGRVSSETRKNAVKTGKGVAKATGKMAKEVVNQINDVTAAALYAAGKIDYDTLEDAIRSELGKNALSGESAGEMLGDMAKEAALFAPKATKEFLEASYLRSKGCISAEEYGERIQPYLTLLAIMKSAKNAQQRARNKTKPNKSVNTKCFVAGTLIATEDGYKPIEEIEIGDRVISFNEDTREVVIGDVINTFTSETDILAIIHIGGEVIRTTTEHPFWLNSSGWRGSRSLLKGDLVKTLDGDALSISKIEFKQSSTQVYNFEVVGCHTYYISNMGILVHNSCRKARTAKSGETVETPSTHPENFTKNGRNFKHNKTGEVWQKSNTNHSQSQGGEWKVGLKKGQAPLKSQKVTVSNKGTVIKRDG
ncbi:polymorphic toxin-type HINT domain-containing protein, partial [Planctomycetota bacterium]